MSVATQRDGYETVKSTPLDVTLDTIVKASLDIAKGDWAARYFSDSHAVKFELKTEEEVDYVVKDHGYSFSDGSSYSSNSDGAVLNISGTSSESKIFRYT